MRNEKTKQDSLILPNSAFTLIWSVLFSLSIIAYSGSALFQIAFAAKANQALNSSVATICILIFCAADTLISINTGIIIDGKLIKNRYQNFRNYFYSFLFIADFLLGMVLIARIILGSQNQDEYSLALSVLDLGVCLKFYNINRYEKDLKLYYFSEWSLLIFQFFKYLILLAFLCHIVACAFFLLDVLLIQAEWYPLPQHWLISSAAMPQLYYDPLWQQYLYSFYFSIVTLSTVAYGDITPLNPTQVSFVLCILAFLLIFYAYIFTQIYQVVNWFNRKSIEIQQNKHKIANFLKKLKISSQLSGKIISQYEFREDESKKTNKELFINDISMKLAKNYSSTPYKHDAHKFMPRFIKRIGLSSQVFNGTLAEKFFTPQDLFYGIETDHDGNVERLAFFISDKKVFRKITTGTSSIIESAQQNRWLGLNSLISSQYDGNQKWYVESPLELIALKFQDLKICLKQYQKSNQRFLQECHRTACFGGTSQDMNKCLICWQGHHSSLYCIEYRPQSKNRNGENRGKNYKVNRISRLIKECQNQRQHIKRVYKNSNKIIRYTRLVLSSVSSQTQTNKFEKDTTSRAYQFKQSRGMKQIVWDWQYYMNQFNIPKYENLVGTVQRELMTRILTGLF